MEARSSLLSDSDGKSLVGCNHSPECCAEPDSDSNALEYLNPILATFKETNNILKSNVDKNSVIQKFNTGISSSSSSNLETAVNNSSSPNFASFIASHPNFIPSPVVDCSASTGATDCRCWFDSLPDEILVHILGFLKVNELLISSQVCTKWKAASRDPLLWRTIRVYLSKRNLNKFCTFLHLVPYVKALHVTGEDLCDNNCQGSESDILLSSTLKNLRRLKCFRIESKFCQINLPSTLQHFEANGFISDDGIGLVLSNCPQLQYINIIPVVFGDPYYSQIGVNLLIQNASDTLQTLFFCGYELYSRCSKIWFENCSNLSSIGIDLQSRSSLHGDCVSLIETLASLKGLKNLFLRDGVDLGFRFGNSLNYIKFPTLEYLSIVNCDEVDETFFEILIEGAPNLKTFSVKDTTFRHRDFLNFISNHINLKRLILGYRPMDLLIEIYEISKTKHFESICVCDNFLGLNRYGLSLEPNKIAFCTSNFKCIQCEPDDLDLFTCGCFGFRNARVSQYLGF